MRDERELDRMAEAIAAAAPPATSADRVEMTIRRTSSEVPSRRGAHYVRPVAATALVLAVAIVVFSAVNLRPGSTMAYAKEDALAALIPESGKVIHFKTRTWAQNEGEEKPVVDGSVVDESWIDFENHRDRWEGHDTKTGKRIGVAVRAEGRFRYLGDDMDTPQADEVLNESYATGQLGEGVLWPYYYLRNHLPDGKVVGEVERDGETYWDVRWQNVKDSGGLELDARALLRQPDYRPAYIERRYTGGGNEKWEVLEWEVLSATQLPERLLDPMSLGSPGIPLQVAWRIDDISEHVSYPIYWVGEKLSEAGISGEMREVDGKVTTIPQFVVRTGDYPATATKLIGDHTVAWYSGDEELLTIASAPVEKTTGLAERLEELLGEGAGPQTVMTSVGEAHVGSLKDGTHVAAIASDHAAVVIESTDRLLLEKALALLTAVK